MSPTACGSKIFFRQRPYGTCTEFKAPLKINFEIKGLLPAEVGSSNRLAFTSDLRSAYENRIVQFTLSEADVK